MIDPLVAAASDTDRFKAADAESIISSIIVFPFDVHKLSIC